LLGKPFAFFFYFGRFMFGIGTESCYFLVDGSNLSGCGISACCCFLNILIGQLFGLFQFLRRPWVIFYLIGNILEFCMDLVKIEVGRLRPGRQGRACLQDEGKAQTESQGQGLSADCRDDGAVDQEWSMHSMLIG